MFSSIVDTRHQPSGRRVVSSCRPTSVIPVSELLPLCAQGINLVYEQDCRTAIDRLLEQGLDMTFRFTNILMVKTGRRHATVVELKFSRRRFR